ncbi:Uncharacterised protein [Mycobacteroides abscessus subsp. abscessus]|nr:Uncharacterised protein [Mycobacteroides abscessus subsp. abscessus]
MGSSASSPSSLAASVSSAGLPTRPISVATVEPSSLGDNSTGIAPTRAAAHAARVMSKPSDLWMTSFSPGATPAARSRRAMSSTADATAAMVAVPSSCGASDGR